MYFRRSAYPKAAAFGLIQPVHDLRCGVSTLREKIQRQYQKAEVGLHSRSYLAELLCHENPGMRVNSINDDGYHS
jgi:hypothetical protein